MLVLSRREGEKIRIGTDVVITIQELRCGRVRLAIEAPMDVTVHREEVYREIERKPGRFQPKPISAKHNINGSRIELTPLSSI